MERLAELIGKLKEQFEQKTDHAQLLITTQMIEQELMRSVSSGKQNRSTSKVAVVMPSGRKTLESMPAVSQQTQAVKEPALASVEEKVEEQPVARQEIIAPAWNFDPLKEIPTLAHQQVVKELNEVMGGKDASLNDKLKAEVVEIGHRLTDSPIRDLKKAIGVNDRFVFINDLFRGDEVMYERSVKTINAFRIFAEAEYWIERELKVKLGWEEDKSVTKQFYQLIKRRFQ